MAPVRRLEFVRYPCRDMMSDLAHQSKANHGISSNETAE
jgi:hypothetical protein